MATVPVDSPQESVPPIPKRPLTAYNIFSIMERHRILQQNQTTPLMDGRSPPRDPYCNSRPLQYRHVQLPPNWYVVGMNRKKRQHHQNHGVVSFNSLSKMVSDAWNAADGEVKAYCRTISNEELKRYRHDQSEFKKRYGEEAFESQTRKRKNAEMAERGIIKEKRRKVSKVRVNKPAAKAKAASVQKDRYVQGMRLREMGGSLATAPEQRNGDAETQPRIQSESEILLRKITLEDERSAALALLSLPKLK